jgi:hypothetical protein
MEEASGDLNIQTPQSVPGPMSFVGVCNDEGLQVAWPRVREWIDAALAHSLQDALSLADVEQRLASREYLLVIVAEPAQGSDGHQLTGAAVLSIERNLGRPSAVMVLACGGRRMDGWLGELVEAVRKIAIAAGVERIILIGRPGWQRVLKGFKVEHRASVLCYSLTPQEREQREG